jgi:ubiquinone/menaquinone biosynthesis C-methylase UbiE
MTTNITDHYSFGGLRGRIENGLAMLNSAPTVETLGPVDEFHIGGRAATAHLVEQLDLDAGDHVLDIGSGLGGTARFMAASADVTVTGVDLTEEYVQVATWLTELVDLSASVHFIHASAAELPVPAQAFAAATMVHVGMNIPDKAAVFGDIANQLAPGGVFGIYDLMVAGEAHPDYPVPWAATRSTSFLETPARYVAHLEAAGFRSVEVIDRTQAALAAFEQLAAATGNGPPALGLHLVMGPDTPTKFGNLVAAVRSGAVVPTEIIARR